MEQKKYFITVTNDANWMCKKKRQIKVGTADPVFFVAVVRQILQICY